MLPYAYNFLSIGCDFTRWGIDGDRNRVSPRIRKFGGIVYFVTPAVIYCRRSPLWNSVPPQVAIPSLKLSFALSSKLISSTLPMHSNDFLASICTSELFMQGYIKLQPYCIIVYLRTFLGIFMLLCFPLRH